MILQRSQLIQYAQQAGFSGSALNTIVAIAFAESGGNTGAYNGSDPFGGSFGVLQINGAHFQSGTTTQACALDPACAFRFAYGLYQAQGFQPWGTYTSGAYLKFLQGSPAPSGVSTPGISGSPLSYTLPNPLAPLQTVIGQLGGLWDWLQNPVRIFKMLAGITLIGGSLLLLFVPEAQKVFNQVAGTVKNPTGAVKQQITQQRNTPLAKAKRKHPHVVKAHKQAKANPTVKEA